MGEYKKHLNNCVYVREIRSIWWNIRLRSDTFFYSSLLPNRTQVTAFLSRSVHKTGYYTTPRRIIINRFSKTRKNCNFFSSAIGVKKRKNLQPVSRLANYQRVSSQASVRNFISRQSWSIRTSFVDCLQLLMVK